LRLCAFARNIFIVAANFPLQMPHTFSNARFYTRGIPNTRLFNDE
jgi:hypothetical protein